MIRSEQELKNTNERIRECREAIRNQREEMLRQGAPPEEAEFCLQPTQTFCLSMIEDVEEYQRILSGWLPEVHSFTEVGKLLIAIRIQKQWTQKEFAEKTGVSPAQVCRDEKNEYFGITMERAQRLIDLFGVKIQIEVKSKAVQKSEKIRWISWETNTEFSQVVMFDWCSKFTAPQAANPRQSEGITTPSNLSFPPELCIPRADVDDLKGLLRSAGSHENKRSLVSA